MQIENLMSEMDEQITAWVFKVLDDAPVELKGRGECLLAIPQMIQDMMVRHFAKIGGGSNHITSLSNLNGYTVIPGYELGLVLFHPRGAENPERGVYRAELEVGWYSEGRPKLQ